MTKPSIIVLGSCNMDIYAYTEHLPEPGETVIGSRYYMPVGGKGANQAVAASKLGADVKFVGRFGDDLFGQQMIETLSSYHIDCRHVKVDKGAGSGMALIVVDKKPENIIVVVPGTNMRITHADVDDAAEDILSADILVMQLEIPLDAVEHAIDLSKQGKTICILNPAPARPLSASILCKTDILTPNQNEAKILTGISADTLDGAREAGKALIGMGVKNVIITLGSQGAMLISDNESVHIPAFPIADAVDPSGAGDAFMGGLATALAEGQLLFDAARYANACGGLSTRKPGAMPSMPDRNEVDSFIRKY
jgi:ribokinase